MLWRGNTVYLSHSLNYRRMYEYNLRFKEKLTAKLKPMPQSRNIVVEGNLLLFRCLQFIGCLPLSENEEGTVYFSLKSLSTLASVTTGLVYVVLAVFNINNLLENFYEVPTEDKVMIYGIMGFTAMPVFIIFIFLDIKKIVMYLGEWDSYKMKYEAQTGRILFVNYKRKQIFYLVGCMLVSLTIAGYSGVIMEEIAYKYGLHLKMSYIHYIVMGYCSIMLAGAWGLWWFLLKTIRDLAEELCLVFKASNESVGRIAQFRRLWRELRDLTVTLSTAFSTTLTLFLLFGYVVSMVGWFLVICMDVGDSRLNVIVTLGATLYIAIVPESCHVTSGKVAKIFQNEIKVKMGLCVVDSEQNKELAMFEALISDFPPTMMVLGCYALDRRTNISIYLNFAQALAIIYQMRSESLKKVGNS